MSELICYKEKDFRADSLAIIYTANEIIDEYRDMGFSLTLRQLYYQFVARDIIPNTERSYKRLGSIINDGRMAGLIDWEAIEDRTRNMKEKPFWRSPASAMGAIRDQFRINKWKDQEWYPEVWIEKEALVGVIEPVCNELQLPFFACRGYVSQSEQYAAGQRLRDACENGRKPIIFHLGDHDPSGVDMTRDNEDRLRMFVQHEVEDLGYDVADCAEELTIERLALNMDQILALKPPPNPAKITDSRAKEYIVNYGRSSWELDALEPKFIEQLIREAVEDIRDEDVWVESVAKEDKGREMLSGFVKTAQEEW